MSEVTKYTYGVESSQYPGKMNLWDVNRIEAAYLSPENRSGTVFKSQPITNFHFHCTQFTDNCKQNMLLYNLSGYESTETNREY